MKVYVVLKPDDGYDPDIHPASGIAAEVYSTEEAAGIAAEVCDGRVLACEVMEAAPLWQVQYSARVSKVTGEVKHGERKVAIGHGLVAHVHAISHLVCGYSLTSSAHAEELAHPELSRREAQKAEDQRRQRAGK